MNVSIGDRWKAVIAQAIESGRFAPPDDVVTEAMHLLAARERKLQAIKDPVTAALADPQEVSEAEMDAAIAEEVARLKAEGYE